MTESKIHGLYFDGKSARPIEVVVKCGLTMDLLASDGRTLKKWRWNDLREEDAPPGFCRLSNDREHPLARFETIDSKLIETVRAAAPALQRKRTLEKSGRNKIISLILLAVLSLAGIIVYGIPAIASRITPLVPLAWEKKLGVLIEPQVAKAIKINPIGSYICSTPKGDAAVKKMLVRMKGSADLPFEPDIKVINHNMKNAVALPGGIIFLMKGLIKSADSPDAVAGVLAHELGHVNGRDSIREIAEGSSRSFILSLLLGDVTGSTVVIFASQALLGAAYSRDIERNADNFAIARMNEANVSAKPMADLFSVIDVRSKETEQNIFASHPLTRERIIHLTDSVSTSQNSPVLNTEEWQALRTMCD